MTADIRERALEHLDLPSPAATTRVVVAMSGGVDSSVTAALLADAGYDVVGITLQLYDHGAAAKAGSCCAGRDVHDARQVAAKLGIAHYVLDYESRFRDAVIEDFADSYLNGETPVPCIRCNQSVKFTDLLGTARKLGAAALATGHYIASRKAGRHRAMFRAADADRDQSYFLFATSPAELEFLRFPLGNLTKPETRALAEHYRLEVAAKPDSQDICFVPDGRYASVIERLRPEAGAPGEIVDRDGRVLGQHDGIMHYTIGQRRGLGLSGGAPLYVIALEPETRRVVVGPREALLRHRLCLREINWLGEGGLEAITARPDGLDVHARIRSTSAPAPATLYMGADGAAEIVLHEGEYGVSGGQACVFYDSADPRARVLGGGWIETRAFLAARSRPETAQKPAKRVARETSMRQVSGLGKEAERRAVSAGAPHAEIIG